MNPVPRNQNENSKEVQEFLDNGGKIQTFAYGERTENIPYTGGFYGKRAKQKDQKEDDK
jgi:hypothetical protein